MKLNLRIFCWSQGMVIHGDNHRLYPSEVEAEE